MYTLFSDILLIGSFIACLIVAMLAQKGIVPNAPAGLLKRVAILIGWSWIALLALRLLSQMRPPMFSVRSR